MSREEIIQMILDERKRQDEKWGANRELTNFTWLAILIEEVGEVAEASLKEVPIEEGVKEIVQVAAVTLAWLEALYYHRKYPERYCSNCRLECKRVSNINCDKWLDQQED